MCEAEPLNESSIRNPDRSNANRRNRHVLIKVPDSNGDRPYKLKTKLIIAGLVALIFVSALCGYLIGSAESSRQVSEPPDPVEPRKPSESKLRVFQKAAVCTDAPHCSDVGREILNKNGSAVDATIAAMFCNGLYNQATMGIGGGFFMVVYIKEEEKAYAVNAREKAPAASTRDMFNGDFTKSSRSPQAIGIPGEIRGMWAAHQRWGKLPWASLIEPTLEVCKKGYAISKALYDGFYMVPIIKNDPQLRKVYVSPSTGDFYKEGTVVNPSETLCRTFKRIAENGANDFYNGSLARDIVDDLKRVGSIITAEDLRNYEAKIVEPLALSINDGDVLYTPPLPSSGPLVINILNILRGYHFNASSINSTEDKILTYHRILEAFKFAFAARTKLGDDDFLDVKELMRNITSPEYGNQIRLKINDMMTSNDSAAYGATESFTPDDGTAHLSVIASNGDAVSVTSSTNYYFGIGFTTRNTGIIMNNVMNDFSSPGITNFYGVEPAPANFIAPNKRPLSSMNPAIIVDRNGNAKFVVGASGGTKITTSSILVTMRKLWFGQTIKEAVDEPRIHHQLFPMNAEYEFGLTEDIVNGLKAKGHGMVRYKGRGSIVCAIYRNETGMYANSDFRKGGDVSGIN